MFTIIDIETTGLGSYDEILEVGYIRVDHLCEIKQSGTLFFYKPEFKVEGPAQRVHRLSRAYLEKYENEFDENLSALYTLVYGSCFIGKNSNSFDKPFISRFMSRYVKGLPQLEPNSVLDIQNVMAPVYQRMTAGAGRKKGTLEDYITLLGKTEQDVIDVYNTLNKPEGRSGYHSALYDVSATYVVLKECIKRNMIALM